MEGGITCHFFFCQSVTFQNLPRFAKVKEASTKHKRNVVVLSIVRLSKTQELFEIVKGKIPEE